MRLVHAFAFVALFAPLALSAEDAAPAEGGESPFIAELRKGVEQHRLTCQRTEPQPAPEPIPSSALQRLWTAEVQQNVQARRAERLAALNAAILKSDKERTQNISLKPYPTDKLYDLGKNYVVFEAANNLNYAKDPSFATGRLRASQDVTTAGPAGIGDGRPVKVR
ncbi:MAG: hypothetical protein AMXMBFR7_34250 [Planctomycetota bacterium]